MNYKIVEIFDSVQGEGMYSGQRQVFVRLAGCNVGKYIEPKDENLKSLRVLNPKYSVCKSIINEGEFICDTNYFFTEVVTELEIIKRVTDFGAKTICITGGEPFLWNLSPIVCAAWDRDYRVHIETSGTLPFTQDMDHIACSPKSGFLRENLDYINEFKFVVGKDLNLSAQETVDKIKSVIEDNKCLVYISPINDIDTINKENTEFALEVIKLGDRRWRLNTQIHKIHGLR